MAQSAKIHSFNGEQVDAYGDPLLGHYYELINEAGVPLGGLMGPYKSALEAEEACQRAYNKGDF